jgi:RNA polymerase sigma-70 factor (ECF subfamily)
MAGSAPDAPRSKAGKPVQQPASEPPSIELLQRAQAGDAAALDRLCARYLKPLQRWASGRLPRGARGMLDTDDVVQETLMRALARVEGLQLEHPGALQAYLRQAVRNRMRDEARRNARRPGAAELDSDLADAGATSPLDTAIGAEAMARYERGLDTLGDEERAAVVVRVELGMSYAEIAAEFGKPSTDAARMMVSRALLRLAEVMADDT